MGEHNLQQNTSVKINLFDILGHDLPNVVTFPSWSNLIYTK